MKKEIENIELRSQEVQEVLGQIPSRIIRYGITVIISVVLILFIGSFFFRYPDIIVAPIEIVTENPPASIMAKNSGNITQIFVIDSQYVETGQKLAVLKNSAQFEHVELLKNVINTQSSIQLELTDQYLSQFPDTLILGEIQSTYSSFLKTVVDYKQFLKLNYYPRKIKALHQKQIALEKYASIMQHQVELKEQDYALAEKQFSRDSSLFKKEVISLSDIEKSKAILIQNSLSLEAARSASINTRMQGQDLAQEIVDLEAEDIRQKNGYKNSLLEGLKNLESLVAWWYDTYVLVASIDGLVAFNKIWSTNQYVEAGNEVFIVLPLNKSKIIGRITLAMKGAGKVESNQEVNIKFDNFPYQEFGMISTRVLSVSMISSDKSYVVEVNLPDTLVTNYGYVLPFTQKMEGRAEIITDDMALIARLFNPLKAIFKNNWGPGRLKKDKNWE